MAAFKPNDTFLLAQLPPRPSRTFDAAQLEILKLMQRDSLPRFRAGDAWIRFMVDS